MSLNILIVDDSEIIRRVVKKVIKQAGINADMIYEAADGMEALEIIKAQPVDLVLSDINMPRMDGLQMLMHLRQIETKENLPVIVISTEGSEETVREAMELGATGYVLKPFSPEKLVEQLRPLGLVCDPPAQSEVDLSNPDAF
jgi:two-component system, chemotaxis family, chemotaxis protein CheY